MLPNNGESHGQENGYEIETNLVEGLLRISCCWLVGNEGTNKKMELVTLLALTLATLGIRSSLPY